MPRYVATVRTELSPKDAFAFVADLRNLAVWDPGVRTVEQTEGDGVGADATYDVTLSTAPMTLTYETRALEPNRSVTLEATTPFLRSLDIISVAKDGAGSIVTYDATLSLRGPLGLADPLMVPVFNRIGDKAAAGLRESLEGVVVASVT